VRVLFGEGVSASESAIQRDILAYLATRPDIAAWRNNTGTARSATRFVRFGVKGQADISGLIAPNGRRLEIEVKTDAGRQSADQRKYQKMIEKYGGVYVLARSVAAVAGALPNTITEPNRHA